MEQPFRKQLFVYSGSSHPALAEEVAKNFGEPLGEIDVHRFSNGEVYARLLTSVRGSDAFVIQTHSEPVNEHLMELLVILDALKRASSARVTAVLPFFPYSRQDKKSLAREPISAKLVADLLHTAGADRVMSVDLHAGQIQGFFDMPFDHLTAQPVLVDHLKSELGTDLVICSPDAGRVAVADKYARKLDAKIAILHKRRDPNLHNQAQTLEVVGEVEGRRCVLVDDMIDTAGTICSGAEALVAQGASEVYAACTHPVFSGPAIDRLTASPIRKVFVTNTIPLAPEKVTDKVEILSVGSLIADAVRAVFEEESVSGIFDGEN